MTQPHYRGAPGQKRNTRPARPPGRPGQGPGPGPGPRPRRRPGPPPPQPLPPLPEEATNGPVSADAAPVVGVLELHPKGHGFLRSPARGYRPQADDAYV